MDNQNMTYPELRDLFVEHNKTQLAKPVSAERRRTCEPLYSP